MNDNIFLLLGSNMGNREANLAQAKAEIESISKIKTVSSVYRTEAWGKTDQPEFLNQVLAIHTEVHPEKLLDQLLLIEQRMGRKRNEKWGSRTIDIDILFYKDRTIRNDRLIIPHPGIPYRRFTLEPLHEIAPALVHPLLHKTISELLDSCDDTTKVEKMRQASD